MKIKKTIAALLSMALLLMAALPALAEDAPQTFSYIDDGSEIHQLDAYGLTGELKPVILEIHGGGFFGGEKESNADHCRVFENAGFAVFSPNYTLMPAADFKDIEGELFAFLHWVGDHAEKYQLDLDRVYVSADSAGGFLALLTAAILASEDLQTWYGVTPPPFHIAGYALTCPVTDLDSLRDAEKGFKSFMASQMNPTIFEDADVYSHADLYQIIDPATFPEVYFLTTPTDMHFHADAVKLDEFLTAQGIAHEYRVYEGNDRDLVHVFNVGEPDSEEGRRANQDIIDYLNR